MGWAPFSIISAALGCDVVFEAIATNWLKWPPQQARSSPPRARPTFFLSGLGHTSCLAPRFPATSLGPKFLNLLSFGTLSLPQERTLSS